MPYKCFLLILVFFSSALHAQNPPRVCEREKNAIEYQWPEDGYTYIPAKATIIIRPQVSILRGRSAHDFSFRVHGQTSGAHTGKTVITDENRTVLFLPDKPFALDEGVHVDVALAGTESTPLASFGFRITPMSDAEILNCLGLLKTEERKEIAEFQKKSQVTASKEIQSIPLDTLPPQFPKILIDTLDPFNVAPGNVFLSPAGSSCITIVDNAGNPSFVREVLPQGAEDFKMELNNTLSYFKIEGTQNQNFIFGTVYLMNNRYVVIDSFTCDGYLTDDHDFRLLPNGHVLLLAYDARTNVDMRTVTGDSNAAKNATVIGAIIQEIDTQTKKSVFTWRSWDHFPITDMTNFDLTSPNHTLIDYAHINSVEGDTDGNLIASFRHMDEVTKINRTNGKIIWRWGGKNNFFTFVGDTLLFSHQHDVRRIANGHITMWDNGNYRKTIWGDGSYHDTSYSRAIEYDVDENSLRATAIWQYNDVPFSEASGNVQRLANGNTFIGLGTQNIPNAIEVTPSGKKVFQLSLLQNPYNYRSFRFQWQPASDVSQLSPVNSFAIGSIYPNPAVNMITVSFSVALGGLAQIELLDVLGNTVSRITENLTESGEHSRSLDVHELPNGVYYCKLSQNGNTTIKMVVVEK